MGLALLSGTKHAAMRVELKDDFHRKILDLLTLFFQAINNAF